jgi:hypothetical protein
VKRFTKSKWSHVGIIYNVEDKHVVIAEALSNGFVLKKHNKKKLAKRIKNNSAGLREIPVPHCSPTLVIRNYLGTKYGKMQIGLIAISILFGRQVQGDKDKTLICSEAVAQIIKKITANAIDIADSYGVPQDYVYPKHLMNTILLKKVTK